MKNHAVRSPVVMGIAGALLGTLAARLIRGATAGQRRERIEWQEEDRGPELKQRAAELTEDVKEKAGELKDRAADAIDGVRDRASQGVAAVRGQVPSVEEIRSSASSAYRFATEDQPALGAILAMGIGMALGFLIPVSEKEGRVIAPLKQRAAENIGKLDETLHEAADKLEDRIAAAEEPRSSEPDLPFGAAQSRPPFPKA
jgi:hypothetical protein